MDVKLFLAGVAVLCAGISSGSVYCFSISERISSRKGPPMSCGGLRVADYIGKRRPSAFAARAS